MRKNILIIIFIFIISISCNFFCHYSNARTHSSGTAHTEEGIWQGQSSTEIQRSSSSSASTDVDDIIDQGNDFINVGKEGKTRDDKKIETLKETTLKRAVKNIYNVLLVIGIAVSVIIAGIMGIQIILGSAEEKAKIEEQMIPYIIGCAVMFGAFAIWKIAMLIAGAVS